MAYPSPVLLLFLLTVLVASGQYYPAYTSSYFRSPYATRYSGGGYYGGLNYPYQSQNYYNGYYNNIPGRYYNLNNYNRWSPVLAYQGGYNSGFGGGYGGYSAAFQQQGYPYSGISYNGLGNYKK